MLRISSDDDPSSTRQADGIEISTEHLRIIDISMYS